MKVEFTIEELSAFNNMYEHYAQHSDPSTEQYYELNDVLQLLVKMWDEWNKEEEEKWREYM